MDGERCEVLLISVSPGGVVGGRGSGNGLLDFWYRLEWELLVLYGLVPVIDTGIAVVIWGRGSVVGGACPCGEVYAVGNEKVVKEVTWVKQGCRCCSWNPGIPKTVAGITPGGDRPAVVAQLESDLVIGKFVLISRRGGLNDIGGRAGG